MKDNSNVKHEPKTEIHTGSKNWLKEDLLLILRKDQSSKQVFIKDYEVSPTSSSIKKGMFGLKLK